MGRLRQAARTFADSTLMAARPLRWAVRVYSTTDRETTGLVEVERIVLGGGDRFWVQVRNSVYLATDDLIWIIKDTAAQGNWTFDGFVEGGGTGESPANSPIPSVAAPVYTAPDNMPVVIRPPAGEDMTLGRAGETIDVAGGLTVAEGITFSNLGAGIVQASAAGVLSSDYIIDATTTWATATNIVPTDASGQDLGDATHRWDLYTQDVVFGGATGANAITFPDNLADALHLSDAGGVEYMRTVSTNAQPVVVFNDGGVDVDFIVEAVGHADALQVQGSDGQITLGMLTQGIVSSDAGGVLSVTAGSAIVGSGVANQVAYWTAANTLAGDAGLLIDAANDMLIVADGGGIGNAVGTARLVFDSSGATDYASIMGAYLGVGILAATSPLHLTTAAYPQVNFAPASGHSFGRFTRANAAAGQMGFEFCSGAVYEWVMYMNINSSDMRFWDGTADRVIFWAGGKVTVGAAGSGAQLHIDQSSSTAAIPVLILDQADVSEEMIEFIGTIGVGNAIEAVGGKTLTTTHFIKITLPGALTRYIPVGTIA